ncbi:hypothetical protein Tco_1430822 [Tanacetum coccineum]
MGYWSVISPYSSVNNLNVTARGDLYPVTSSSYASKLFPWFGTANVAPTTCSSGEVSGQTAYCSILYDDIDMTASSSVTVIAD